ncbi:BZ3500_MvSof-1268-A1-R1_Chr1-3g02409 [Microbotryum saponariae]|uniref:BZ3500_MvSof-1268-A1-R1_Chr1-3g02409 protein n=1 Tax=Microbotryum saponariae TaxID=289078 RepID=A0A2X0KIZ3_9BASI|nr:BZ3500_MvSof-1268-A1-R1_Chr1-3g02409 [Microbotryum saponariae]SCZ96196.1 BZ3501_MvSof-1269-A2-R1_Chr1-3g02012 [Microbotryum saponariae]
MLASCLLPLGNLHPTSPTGSFTYVATGTNYPAGPALVKDILFLADQLSISEHLAASLVSYAINAKPRAGRGRAESGLVVFLDERAALIASLHAIWRGALSADERLAASGLQRVFERETEELVRGKGASVNGDANDKNKKRTWVQKLVETIEHLRLQSAALRSKLEQPLAAGGAGFSSALVPAQGSTSSPSGNFADEVVEMRIQRYDDERRGLAQLLFFLGAARQINKDELLALARRVSTTEANDPPAVYLLLALLAALDCSDESSTEFFYPLFTDSAFVNSFNQLLQGKWAVPQLKAAVQLQWTIFLDAAARAVPNFETDGGEFVDVLTWQALDAGVFGFLGRSVLAFKMDSESSEIWSTVGSDATALSSGSTVEPWFQEHVTQQIEVLVLDVLTNKISILRKLRNREEDVESTSHRGGGFRSSQRSRAAGGDHDEHPIVARHDLEAFFLLIATLYRGEPDSGLKFWEEVLEDGSTHAMTSRLSAFLRWGSECRPPAMMRAFYEMVASLASGPISATYAFEFLGSSDNGTKNGTQASPTFSWSALFGALEFYHTNLPDRPMEAGANAEGVLGEMPPEEVPILRSFVRLLRQVVSYSDVARATLYDNQRHRPIATLFALLGRPIPIELKASLISAIAAFSRPGGTFGVDVARRTWTALEQSQILPTLAPSEGKDARGGAGLAMGRTGGFLRGPGPLSIEGGLFTELEEVEAPNKVYPESTAFVQLLNTLIHTPSTLEPLRRGVEIDSHTIPDNLGAPHRAPGIDPYLKFVIDDVLLKTGAREFADQRERWKVTDACLLFVEKCLASYDLGPFLAWISAGGQRASGNNASALTPLAHLTVHPGFEILTRLLSSGPLLDQILTIIIAGQDAIQNNLAGTPLFTSCMLRCMRIVKRSLELQAPFLEVVVPSIAETSLPLLQDKLNRLKTLSPIDQLLLYQSEAIVQIALLINCEEEDEIALLAVQVLATIAESPFFDVVQKFPEQSRVKLNRLVGLLQASPETLRILDGVILRLEADIPESDLELGEPDGFGSGSIRQAIRSALLDLMLQNTQPGKTAPNIAHLLLGFNVRGRLEEMQIDDPDAADTQRTSLHVVLDLLAQNVSKETDVQMSILSRHPTFAAKCYRLIRQLCLHPYTSSALSRYLRNREQFFFRQTQALPFGIPAASGGALGGVQYVDGKQLVTSSSAVCAILQSQAWLLESTALELNMLANSQDTRRQVELVGTLFENPTSGDAEITDAFDQDAFDQALPRMLEIFHALDFSWHDSIAPNEYRLSFFAELRFDACLKTDSTGCEVYDFGAVLSLLSAARRELQNRGMLSSSTQQEEAKRESKAILETLVIENHRREIQFARYHALRAWRSLLDITLTKSFHLLPSEGRHSLLLDLMSAILPPLAASETEQAISELLAGAAVLLMTKLSEEGIRVVFFESAEAVQSVSPERLHAVLRVILQAILQPGVSPIVRGNLYAVLLNYIQYSSKMASLSPSLAKTLGNGSVADDASILGSLAAGPHDDLISLDGLSSIGGGPSSRAKRNLLEAGNFSILHSAIERLLPVICRDAAAGHEVWRTVAFTALDALMNVAEEARASSRVLSILSKQGYLQNFVAALKGAEADLQEALKPDPESLNALYVYEAQMSFLIRLASTREGAEKLMDAEVLAKLADCDYLGSRPVADTNSMGGSRSLRSVEYVARSLTRSRCRHSTEFEGFLPPASERHHQLLLPALQLVVGTLVSFGADTQIATRQALAFVGGQRENLLVALKDCANLQTVSSLREAHLIVTLLSIVLPSVSDEDLTTLSSFGGLHAALLNLSAKTCGPQDWVAGVLPSNETERDEDRTLVLGFRHDATIFSDKVETLVESLEAAILTYQSVATRKKQGTNAFRPVWAPSLSATEATLGSAGAFLRDTAMVLKTRLDDVTRLVGYLDGFDTTSLEEIEEVFSFPEEEGIDVSERRQRVLQELQALHATLRVKVTSSLHLLELGLLLYWRHIAFFLDPERLASEAQSSRPEFGVGLAETLRTRSSTTSISPFDLPTLRDGVAKEFNERLSPLLAALEFNQKNVGSSWRNREQYVGVVARRLQSVLLLDA